MPTFQLLLLKRFTHHPHSLRQYGHVSWPHSSGSPSDRWGLDLDYTSHYDNIPQ